MRRKLLHPPKALYRRVSAKDIRRFMAKIAFSDCGCWLWTGYLDSNRYGQFRFHGQSRGSHRIAWLIFRGSLRARMEIDHKHERCPHNCVNPDHLRQVSMRRNATDGGHRRWSKRKDEHELPI